MQNANHPVFDISFHSITFFFFQFPSRFLSDTKVRQVKRKFCNRKWGKDTFFTELGGCLEPRPVSMWQKGLPKAPLSLPKLPLYDRKVPLSV